MTAPVAPTTPEAPPTRRGLRRSAARAAVASERDPRLASALAKLPDKPGVYLMKDARGDVVYVGKAQSLRNRVRSYWQKQAPGGEIHRIRSVIDRVADVEVTQTDSVSEALLLEANLIKRYRPRFNVRLKDDKSYPYIKVTLGDDFPRVERTRKLVNDGSRYFGPYASASSVDESMNLVRRLFPFRTCTIDIKDGVRALQRPCLLYHIKRCQGPCITAISKDDYRADIEQVELFLEGRQETLVKALDVEMTAAAERTEYERAGALRDKIRAIERTMESQKMAAFARTELDLLGLARQDNQAAIQLFVIRDGKMIGRDVFLLEAAREATDDEVLSSFLEQYYGRAGVRCRARSTCRRRSARPPSSRRSWPSDAAGRSTCASRSAARSASSSPSPRATRARRSPASRRAGWPTRARRCRPRGARRGARPARAAAPHRVLRHQQLPGQRIGRQHGRLRGRQAALRRVPAVPDQDRHRPERLRQPPGGPAPPLPPPGPGEEGAEEARRWSMPDLVIVDGGKGQVSAAKEVLDELGLHDLPLAGLAKEREELFLPGRSEPDRAARHVAGPVPRPAAARRGAPLRDHLPPRPAGAAQRALGVRRPARRRAEAQARAAQGVRLDQAGARRAGRADRGRARASGPPLAARIKATLEA